MKYKVSIPYNVLGKHERIYVESFYLQIEQLYDKSMSTTINTENDLVTLINIFNVTPDKQQALVDVLAEASGSVMKQQPGFISANIHKSFDGTRVVNYVQWKSKADFEAMLQKPEAQPHMTKAAALAEFEPKLYEVAFVTHT